MDERKVWPLIGVTIAIVWIWFALLGVQTLPILVSLFIAIALTMFLGVLGAVLTVKPKES